MHIRTSLAAALLLGATSLAAQAGTLWSTEGFDMPESVLFDPANDRLVVSVMEGAPNAVDGNGHLALLSRDGQVLDTNWATGMDAPKGMALMDGKIFAADLTHLRVVDAATGRFWTPPGRRRHLSQRCHHQRRGCLCLGHDGKHDLALRGRPS